MDRVKRTNQLWGNIKTILSNDSLTTHQKVILLNQVIQNKIEDNTGWLGFDKFKRWGATLREMKVYLEELQQAGLNKTNNNTL